MNEIWKDIPNFEGLYKISNLGRVKSELTSKILKSSPNSCGYQKITLYKNHKPKMFYIHRLVAGAFLDNPDNKTQVNHIDGNKNNNNISNLEWCTPSENQQHALKMGLHAPSPFLKQKGSKHPFSRVILQCDKDGKILKEWGSIVEAAKFLKCNPSSISNCLTGRTKTSCGFIWKYK